MKGYEEQSELRVPYNTFIVRLDGNRFSKFTRKLQQPFDTNFTKAMVLTASDLLNTYMPSTAYTHSDEITLIFPKKVDLIFSGRISKIVSEFSSFCSLRFTYHLKNLLCKDTSLYDYSNVIEILENPTLNFDARVIIVPEDYEIVNHQIWRSTYDCFRNCVSKLADMNYSSKELYKKNSQEKIDMLTAKNINFNNYPTQIKHIIFHQ